MKLHVGCGKKYLKGWTNLDIDGSQNKVDIIDDARFLHKINDNSCNLIYACHILEHFGRHEYQDVLKIWASKLKKGGILRIAVPNFEEVARYYLKTKNLLQITGLVCGGQKNPYDYHYMIFDKSSLTECLLAIGFKEIREWDWKNTEHFDVDDYSQAYLPHLEKEKGTLMSLNIEAVK